MYAVRIFDGIEDKVGTLIHSPFTDDVRLSEGKVTLRIHGISNMSFTINLKNPGWNKIKPLKTLIKVTDLKRNKVIFNGRVLQPTEKMTKDGMVHIAYAAESILAYLHDSRQRWGEYHNISVRDFLQVIIDNHNRQVEPHKQFKVGNVTVTDPNDSLYRYLGYEDTYDTIKDKLIDRLGGFLIVREEPDGNYLDYLESFGELSDTPIRLRKNLKDMEREIDPTGIITRVIPLGEKIESGDPDNTEASQPRLTIASVNNGVDYLDDEELIKEFGIIEGTIIFDDITQPNILKTRGEQFLANQKAARISYSLSAVDLNLIDDSMDSYEVGNWHPIENPIFGIEDTLQIIEKEIDINDPTQSSLTIGEKYVTLTEYQLEANKKATKVVELEGIVNRQARIIVRLREELQEELQNVNKALDDLYKAIDDMDIDALNEAIDTLEQAIQNLQEAIEQIPSYGPVTHEKDGLMIAADKQKLDRITVTNVVDLDALVQEIADLKARVEELENAFTE